MPSLICCSYHSQYSVVLTFPVTSQWLKSMPFVVMRAHTSAYRNWKSCIARSQVQRSIIYMKWISTQYIEDMKLQWWQYRRNQIKRYTTRIQNWDWTRHGITFKGHPNCFALQQRFPHTMIYYPQAYIQWLTKPVQCLALFTCSKFYEPNKNL